MTQRTGLTALLTLLLFFVTGCEGNNKLAQLTDAELIRKSAPCNEQDLSPGMAAACGNLLRECERRNKELGSYICGSH